MIVIPYFISLLSNYAIFLISCLFDLWLLRYSHFILGRGLVASGNFLNTGFFVFFV